MTWQVWQLFKLFKWLKDVKPIQLSLFFAPEHLGTVFYLSGLPKLDVKKDENGRICRNGWY